jgi:preprotein translocase subunit YajC
MTGLVSILYWGVLLGIFYLLIIRPQQKKNKQLKDLRTSLQVGDTVITIGGISGRIVSIDEENVILSVEGSNLKLKKWAIGSKDNFQ